MTGGFLGFLGGIGLFLFGMGTMTAALRALAGEGLRQWLLRMTSTPLRGVVTGAAITVCWVRTLVVSTPFQITS